MSEQFLTGTDRWTGAAAAAKLTFIRQVIYRWRNRLLLEGWKLHVQLEATPHAADERCPADIHADHRYRDALVRVYPHMWANGFSDLEREHIIVHELIHALVEPLKTMLDISRRGEIVTETMARGANEVVTSTLTAALWMAYAGPMPETTDVAS